MKKTTTTKSTENSMSVCCCKRVCSMQINNKIGERLLNDLQQQTCTKTSALVEIDCHFYKTTESTLVHTKTTEQIRAMKITVQLSLFRHIFLFSLLTFHNAHRTASQYTRARTHTTDIFATPTTKCTPHILKLIYEHDLLSGQNLIIILI